MVSRTTVLCIRLTDISGRWEGDSILAILHTSDIGTLAVTAERMRGLIASSGIHWWGKVVETTVTIGCTMFRAGDTAESVAKRLTACIEAGDKPGGNRVLVD